MMFNGEIHHVVLKMSQSPNPSKFQGHDERCLAFKLRSIKDRFFSPFVLQNLSIILNYHYNQEQSNTLEQPSSITSLPNYTLRTQCSIEIHKRNTPTYTHSSIQHARLPWHG